MPSMMEFTEEPPTTLVPLGATTNSAPFARRMYALPGLLVVAGPFIDTKLNYYSKRAPRQQ
jgi:hypothetical protein